VVWFLLSFMSTPAARIWRPFVGSPRRPESQIILRANRGSADAANPRMLSPNDRKPRPTVVPNRSCCSGELERQCQTTLNPFAPSFEAAFR